MYARLCYCLSLLLTGLFEDILMFNLASLWTGLFGDPVSLHSTDWKVFLNSLSDFIIPNFRHHILGECLSKLTPRIGVTWLLRTPPQFLTFLLLISFYFELFSVDFVFLLPLYATRAVVCVHWLSYLTLFRVSTFLEFLVETWSCREILQSLGKRHGVGERSGNLCNPL